MQQNSHQLINRTRSSKQILFQLQETGKSKRNQSNIDRPKNQSNNKNIKNNIKGCTLKNTVVQIYSQSQIPKQKKGMKILRNISKSKNNNDSLSKLKQQLKNTTLNFYQCIKNKPSKMKHKQQTSPTLQFIDADQLEIQQLHYQMVKANQNVKKLQQFV